MIAYFIIMDSKTFLDRFYSKIQLEKAPDETKLTKVANLALLGNCANIKALCDQNLFHFTGLLRYLSSSERKA